MDSSLPISLWQMGLTLFFVVFAGAISLILSLGLTKNLFIGTVRTFAQLFLMGYALKYIFALKSSFLIIAVFSAMIAAAAHIVRSRVPEKEVGFGLPVFLAMAASYILVTITVTSIIIQADPWWHPQYFLTIGGMVAGNSMNALAIALERLFSSLRQKRAEVEMKLCLGAGYKEASHDIMRDALRAGMIPSINSMMSVGIVSIPGMMTGQIIAGADPALAARYQIIVMLMLVASTALSSVIVVGIVRKLCFGKHQELLLSRIKD